MWRFIAIRTLQAIPVIFAVITITFFLVRAAPGGPFSSEKDVSPQVKAALEARYRLDQPLFQQYSAYMQDLVQGDLGPTFRYPGRTVDEMILQGLPVTAELGFYAMVVAVLIGGASGVVASLRPNTLQDYVPMSAAMIGICMPSFLLGPLLVLIFGIWLQWLPVSGWGASAGDKILPSLTLGAMYAGYIARLTRSGMLEVLSQDYLRTARAKGLPEHIVILKHALRGGLLPVVTYLGPAAAGLITGSFVIETVFNIPGLGKYFVGSVFDRDIPVVGGTVFFFSAIILFFNLLVDVAQAWLNPKVRLE